MAAVLFYHLTRSPLEATLPALLAKAQGAGLRVMVRGASDERLDWLDEALWQGDGFLPHGRAGRDHHADQPVLLGTGGEAPNGATCLMAVDGAEVDASEVAGLQKVCILFDGNDPDALSAARGQWKSLTGAGCAAEYWSQEDGSWAVKAKSEG